MGSAMGKWWFNEFFFKWWFNEFFFFFLNGGLMGFNRK
jgi:hypothetical protein